MHRSREERLGAVAGEGLVMRSPLREGSVESFCGGEGGVRAAAAGAAVVVRRGFLLKLNLGRGREAEREVLIDWEREVRDSERMR